MKNIFKTIGIIAFAAIIGFTMTGCDNNTQEQTEYSTKYTWTDSDKSYELLITEGGSKKIVASGSYTLKLNGSTISTGTASGALASLTLTASGNSITLSITPSGKSITVAVNSDNKTLGSTVISGGTGTMEEITISSGSITKLEGTWKWTKSNDEWQIITIRGNTFTLLSRFMNAGTVEDTNDYGNIEISGNTVRFFSDHADALYKFSISGNKLTLHMTENDLVYIKQ